MLPWIPLVAGSLTGVATRVAAHAVRSLAGREIERRALQEAEAEAARMIRSMRGGIYFAILWQNALLLAAIWISLHMASILPFCAAYLAVAGYSVWCVTQYRRPIREVFRTRSLYAVVRREVREAVCSSVSRLGWLERLVFVHLGPDLDALSERVAWCIYPMIRSACVSMGLTLGVSFLVFRVWLVPALARGMLH